MPKKTPVRIIDNRKTNRATTISGVTLTAPDTGVSDHGLLLGLDGDDHPQYLLADGTRTLSGNLAVAAGVTVDGVDISTHAANASAHHAPVTAGDGIGVSGQQVAVDASVVRTGRQVLAGAGMTGGGDLAADRTLAVGAGTLIAVGDDTVGLAPGAAYQFVGTGNDTVPEWRNVSELAGNGLTATNGVLAVGVSGLGLSVAADAVALASSSNPGAAASILASTAAGGLTLVSLGVTEAATVGGDFTVGANVLFVNQAGTRVGINRAPDQQFDLDVAGAIRGQYLVGRHAIQLASAVGVWHFDGAAPYALDYSGSNASHMGVAGTEAGGLIFRPGRYGKAAQVAPATTNLITNPSFETNTTGWATDYPAATTLTRVADGWVGAYFLRVAATGTGNFYSPAVTVANGTAYAVSFWYRTNSSVQVRVRESGTNTSYGTATLPVATEWTRYTILLTTPANGSSTIRLIFDALAAGESIDIDAVQVEQAEAATPYCDGSLGSGHSWTGTAHASTSSRTGATLTYPVGIGFDAAEGSILMWVRLDGVNGNGVNGVFGTGANAQFDAYVDSSGSLRWRQAATTLIFAAAIAADDWHLLGFTWSQSGNARTIFVDGVAVATRQFDAGATIGSDLYVGSITAGAAYSVNGLVDEFVLTDYAMDAKLVRAIYESDAPVFVESSVFHWRSPSRVPIWVDEFGLWARGVTGNEILGLYGGDPRNPTGGVTKSWGGVTLSENDVLIGRAAGGYVFWDDSAQVLNLKGTMIVDGNSYLNGVVTIAAGGELRQGTGTIGSNYTGLRIWRDGDVGRIGGYNANALQWYAGTDGKFYAGGGNVAVSASGIAIAPNYDSTSLTFTNVGEIYALYDAGFGGTLYLRAGYNRSKESNVLLEAYSGTTVKSSLELGANGIISAVGALGMIEVTAPSAPASNGAYLYLDDNGSGKTRLMVRFSSGSAVQLAIQP